MGEQQESLSLSLSTHESRGYAVAHGRYLDEQI